MKEPKRIEAMKGVSKGNVRKSAARKGWFLGHFMTSDVYRKTGKVEAKWGIHHKLTEKKEKKKPFEGNHRSTSMSILIKGRFRFEFRRGKQTDEAILEKPGDFALWFPKIDHRGFAEVDETVMLTIRWPSLPNDHYDCQK